MEKLIIFYVLYIFCREGNGNPFQYSCLENPMDGGAWWAAVYGVAQSRTRLKRLSSSSSSMHLLCSNVFCKHEYSVSKTKESVSKFEWFGQHYSIKVVLSSLHLPQSSLIHSGVVCGILSAFQDLKRLHEQIISFCSIWQFT